MSALKQSYRYCRQIAKSSHSNFYVAFHLLSGDRRMAMDALYAFARIADDSSDNQPSRASDLNCSWDSGAWHAWVDSLGSEQSSPSNPTLAISSLDPIKFALRDSVHRFAIPLSVLHDMIDGIDFDLDPASQIKTWRELKLYCYRVASSVGVGCLAIWRPSFVDELPTEAKEYAEACGIAFQITNILRDVVEDAGLGRCYLPADDLHRFGLNRQVWTESLLSQSATPTKSHADVLRVNIERAEGYFAIGKQLVPYLCPEGQRMFSLMWKTYHQILQSIRAEPLGVLRGRVRVSRVKKLQLVASHFVTPFYRPLTVAEQGVNGELRQGHDERNTVSKVAIIGGGLAGCNAALHLARHGVQVDLFEARSKLGGRVGSFFDRQAGVWVDYCQHVGMNCCTELKRWIEDTGQSAMWDTQSTLHFVDPRGKKIAIRSLPFPAPFHLASMIFKWPGLGLRDRLRVALGLNALTKLKPAAAHDSQLAMDWLGSQKQTERSLVNFWETILVSALGEKISRVSLGAMRKVLVDGFARKRDAYHLLVPLKPLSELTDKVARACLEQRGVTIHDQSIVTKLEKDREGGWSVSWNDTVLSGYQAVVIAVPWHQISKILPQGCMAEWSPQSMQSSPITGIHTWWDRPWLGESHAIFVQGLCQWVFPGKHESSANGDSHAYYQIVISASQELRSETPDQILQRVVDELRVSYPASAQSNFVRGKIVTDPQAVFSISPEADACRWRADQFGADSVFVAGDWTRTEWPATMEGALRSGAKAAECAMASLGVPVGLLSEG